MFVDNIKIKIHFILLVAG